MSPRTENVAAALKAQPVQNSVQNKISLRHETVFREYVFDSRIQELYLPKKVVQHLEDVRSGKCRFETSYADIIAEGLKDWALKMGATHYTHWFHPLTGSSAEKHDSFLSWGPGRRPIDQFLGKELLIGEPDASSFPSGGLRSTHEARGYTSWDPASLPFLWERADVLILCIPSIFYSWKGASLDHRIPLLRSDQKIQHAAMRLLSLCKIKASSVFSTVGLEQEYFLLDRSLFALRPDLVLSGRTVFGAKSSKGQELEDHYLAPVRDREMAFMRQFEEEALKIGIPVKTRHSEVAPAQYEVAPLFEKASTACDHNLALMEIMRQTAAKHDLVCLFHEKPFANLNGSGKHCNWSLATDTGLNLLNPHENSLLFTTLLTAIMHALYEHGGLLLASIASAANDERLGGSEAPPSILSVYLGKALQTLVQEICQNRGSIEGKKESAAIAQRIDLGLEHLSLHDADTSDRNRTSTFAFTGNKFEFRAVGASASSAFPVSILNSIVADSLELIIDEIEDVLKGRKECTLEKALPILRKYLQIASPVLFEGNGYTEEWHQEAEKRGLPISRHSFHAFDQLRNKKSIRSLENVFNEQELESRFEILVEQYAKTVGIEVNLMIELFQTQILPAVQQDLHRRFQCLSQGKLVGITSDHRENIAIQINDLLDSAIQHSDDLIRLNGQAKDLGWEAKAKVYVELAVPKMKELRKAVDALELLVEDDLWPLPKYRELLFHL